MTTASQLNTRQAQEMKLGFLLAAAEGDGDLLPLLMYADWLEEQGSTRRAAQKRRDALSYARQPGRTLRGETWLCWHARYQLGLVADVLAQRETAFRRFRYAAGYRADGSMEQADSSLEYALAQGYVPTLRRSSRRQARLGRIIEAFGYRVFYVDGAPRLP